MSKCAVVDLQTNQQVNFIIALSTDIAPNGCKLVEIPDGSFWNSSAKQVLLNTQYWDGNQIQIIPNGYYWDGNQLQLIGNV